MKAVSNDPNGLQEITPTPLSNAKAKKIHEALATWFESNARPLPWRQDYPPYWVWISEIMLQQTRMETVLPYFQRWISRFPTISSLAAAPLDDVLKLWEGLGYYSRARSLHKAAQIISSDFGRELPHTPENLRKLPGIGPYTAGAIASIAFQQPEPAVDGNAARVLSRITLQTLPVAKPIAQKYLWQTAQTLVELGNPRNLTQAIMELGATICTPRSPNCHRCPVTSHCLAQKENKQQEIPARKKKLQRRIVKGITLVMEHRNKVYLRQRQAKGLWGGLWEVPWLETTEKPSINTKTLLAGIIAETGIDSNSSTITPLGGFHHELTHFRLEMECYHLKFPDKAEVPELQPIATKSKANNQGWWAQEEIEKLALGRPTSKILNLWRDAQSQTMTQHRNQNPDE